MVIPRIIESAIYVGVHDMRTPVIVGRVLTTGLDIRTLASNASKVSGFGW
jgi:hypothetical protein